jgi:hypothetical protein
LPASSSIEDGTKVLSEVATSERDADIEAGDLAIEGAKAV